MEVGRYYRTRAYISSRNRVEGTSTDFEAILSVPIAADGWRLRSATIPMQMTPWSIENSKFSVQWTSLQDASIKITSPLVIVGIDYQDTPNEAHTFNVPPGTYTIQSLAAVLRQLRPAGLVAALTFDPYTEGADKYLQFTTLARPDLLPNPMSIAVSPAWGGPFDLIYTRVGTFGSTPNYVTVSGGTCTFETDRFYDGPAITLKLQTDIGVVTPVYPASGIGVAFSFDQATQNVIITLSNSSTDQTILVGLFFPGPVFGPPGGYSETVSVGPLQTVTRAVYKNPTYQLDTTTEYRFTPNLSDWNDNLPYANLQYVVNALNASLPPLATRANSAAAPWWGRAPYGNERLWFKASNWQVTSTRPLTELGLSTTMVFYMLPHGSAAMGGFGDLGPTGSISDINLDNAAAIVGPATGVTVPAGNYNSSPYVLPMLIQTALQPWNITFDPILESDGSVAYNVQNDGLAGIRLVFSASPHPTISLVLPRGLEAKSFNLGLNAGRFESFRVMPNPDYHVSAPLTLPAAGPATILSEAFVKEEFAHDTTISIADGTYDATQLATQYTAAITASPIGGRMSFTVNNGIAQLSFGPTQAPNNLGHVLIGANDKLGFTKAVSLPAWAQPTSLIPEIAFADLLGPDQTRTYTATRAYRNLPTTSLFIASPTLTNRSVCTMGDRFHSDIIAHVPISNAVQQGDLVEFINPVSEFEPWSNTRTISDIQIRLLDDQMRELGDDGSGQDCLIFLEFLTYM